MSTTTKRSRAQDAADNGFAQRLERLTREFGSRYRLAKATGVPPSTLQSYEAGSKPGLDAIVRIARAGNVDINWLLTGTGEMRGAGMASGAAFADVLMVFLYEMGSSLLIPSIVGGLPFSRHWLHSRLRLKEPTTDTLLAVEADIDLNPIRRGDLVLVDREQASPLRDGIYLLHLPGLALRKVFLEQVASKHQDRVAPNILSSGDLAGAPSNAVVGRAVWVGRAL